MTNPERWLPIPGWEESHVVSDQGRVATVPRLALSRHGTRTRALAGRVLATKATKSGHLTVTLAFDGRTKTVPVHRLVLLAFVGSPKPGLVACHNDGDPTNNTPANLRWDTPSANVRDSIHHGTHFNASKTACRHGHEFDAANTYVDRHGARSCKECRRTTWTKWNLRRRQLRLALAASTERESA